MNKIKTTLIISIVVLSAISLFAQTEKQNIATYTPSNLSYQGYLANNIGEPIDGVTLMSFSIYDVQSEGTSLWNSGYLSVNVSEGYFSAILLEVESIFSINYETIYFEINVQGEILTPRLEITAMPAAISTSHWNGGEVDNPIICNSNITVEGQGEFLGGIFADGVGYFTDNLYATEAIYLEDADEFVMYYRINESTQSPRVLLNTENNYGNMQLRNSENQTKIELNGDNGEIT